MSNACDGSWYLTNKSHVFLPIPGAARIAEVMEAVAFWAVLISAACVLSYLAATPDRPLWDATFARWDAALGFDWLGWFHFVARHRWLHTLLFYAYAGLLLQSWLVLLALPVRQVREMFWLILITVPVTSLIWALMPALAAGVYWLGDTTQPYYSELMLLRSAR
jgi:hypothetical protein